MHHTFSVCKAQPQLHHTEVAREEVRRLRHHRYRCDGRVDGVLRNRDSRGRQLRGQTYGDASKAISDAGKKAVIASREGDTLSTDQCIVTHSQSAPWIKGDHFAAVTDTVLVHLNCNATVATAKDPGNSAGSPEGRAAIAAAQKKQQEAQSGGSGA